MRRLAMSCATFLAGAIAETNTTASSARKQRLECVGCRWAASRSTSSRVSPRVGTFAFASSLAMVEPTKPPGADDDGALGRGGGSHSAWVSMAFQETPSVR